MVDLMIEGATTDNNRGRKKMKEKEKTCLA